MSYQESWRRRFDFPRRGGLARSGGARDCRLLRSAVSQSGVAALHNALGIHTRVNIFNTLAVEGLAF